MKQISTYAKFKIHPGQLAAFKALARQASEIVNAREPGTRFYEWYMNADGTECVALDSYVDIDAMKVHIQNIGPIMRQLLAISDRYVEIYGLDPLPELQGRSTTKSGDYFGATFLSKLENDA